MAGRFQIVGDDRPVNKGKAYGTPSSNPPSGQFQLIGDSKKMSQQPIQSPSSNPKEGQRTLIGDSHPVNRTAVKGWGSAAKLTMSDRVYMQSNNAAEKGGRGKKRR